jgi:choline dehydrogenase
MIPNMIPNLLKFSIATALVTGSVAVAGKVDLYDYVIVGSGPGGGSLAYVNGTRYSRSIRILTRGQVQILQRKGTLSS